MEFYPAPPLRSTSCVTARRVVVQETTLAHLATYSKLESTTVNLTSRIFVLLGITYFSMFAAQRAVAQGGAQSLCSVPCHAWWEYQNGHTWQTNQPTGAASYNLQVEYFAPQSGKAVIATCLTCDLCHADFKVTLTTGGESESGYFKLEMRQRDIRAPQWNPWQQIVADPDQPFEGKAYAGCESWDGVQVALSFCEGDPITCWIVMHVDNYLNCGCGGS